MLNLSTALTEEQVSLVCEGYDAALAEVASLSEVQR
jgi:hypothetical protein